MFGWFKNKTELPDVADFKRAVSIDVSGPEFFDLYPSQDDFAERLRQCGLFRIDAVDWIARAIHQRISAGGGYEGARRDVVQTGRLLGDKELQELGLHKRAKVGDQFVAAVAANDISAAMDRLLQIIHFATSRASQLHGLRRSEEIGVKRVRFMSARDERSTDLERRLEGREMSIAQARKLVLDNSDAISRSVFQAIVEF